ncbi:bifunctional DNA primase/polymerase [Shewanella sp. KX20019]|uniref:bifunctional DNA primase/polymerase n=1 Tax=Shewanella sp. KX20019 TaxID=2803864 RepID=UPI0019286259|nr:bifunctional DNA primase/polymerase [Shewanella sp. KX20019]QQX80837.1 bifunctional DNA primase/polymerase [Shewanella sp. KX20019]
MNNTLTFANQYISLGWRIFPIHGIKNGVCTCGNKNCNSSGKHPALVRSWKEEATTDKDKIADWFDGREWLNIGVATGKESGIIALDFDSYKDGAFSCDEMEIECGGYITDIACIQNTGGGGQHLLFDYPEGESIGSRLKLREGFDVKADGGYIVAAPSLHKSGKHYEWDDDENPWMKELEFLPEGAVEFIKRHVDNTPEFVTEDEPDQTPDSMRRLRSALFYIPADVGRDEWINIGMALHGAGLGDQAYNMWLLWSSTCPEKFTPSTMAHEWKSFDSSRGIHPELIFKIAEKYGWEDPARHQLPEFVEEDFEQAELDESDIYYGVSAVYEAAKDRPEGWWYGAAVFPGAKIVIAGAPKTGKSQFALAMARQAAVGGEFLEEKFTRPIKTLWLQAEIHGGFLSDRLNMLIDTRELSTDELCCLDENFACTRRIAKNLMDDADLKWLAQIIKRKGFQFVIVDPLINFAPGIKESDNAEMFGLLSRLDKLVEFTSVALAVIHHTSKGSKMAEKVQNYDRFESIRGASSLRGWYDSGILLEKEKAGKIRAYFEVRNREGIEPMTLRLDKKERKWVIESEEVTKDENGAYGIDVAVNSESRVDCLVRVLMEHGGQLPRAQAMAEFKKQTDEAGKSESTFRDTQTMAINQGRVKRDKNGRISILTVINLKPSGV